jgi:hypothetical protein
MWRALPAIFCMPVMPATERASPSRKKREALLSFSFLLYAIKDYIAPRSSLIVKFVMSQTSLGPQYWIGPG